MDADVGLKSWAATLDHAVTIGSVVTAPAATSLLAGRAYQHDVQATDADLDPITYSLSGQPTGMTIDQYGRIRWQTGLTDLGPNNTAKSYTFQMLATDNRGTAETPISVTITVQPDTLAPSGQITHSPKPGWTDEPTTIVVSAIDNVGVTSITLTVGGQNVALDDRGVGQFTFSSPGSFAAVATVKDAAGNVATINGTILIASNDPTGPLVTISSPGDRDVVSAPVSVIGTIDDPGNDLTYYLLDLLNMDGDVVRTITEVNGNGNTVPEKLNASIATLDPTTLANGAYVLELTARDLGNHETITSRVVNVDGNLKLGNFALKFTDITVPVAGIPITVTRTYDTLRATERGDFGFGWRMELGNFKVEVDYPEGTLEGFGGYPPFRDGTRVTITREDGKTEGFTFQPWMESKFLGLVQVWHPQFIPDGDVSSRLWVPDIELTKVFGDEYIAWGAAGASYNPANPVFGGTYGHFAIDGFKREISAVDGKLVSAADRHGNKVTYGYDAIRSNQGRQLALERDHLGRIVKITEPRGFVITYGYDPQTGDLISVTDRMGNNTLDNLTDYTTRYSYHASQPHFLQSITDPLGRVSVTTTFNTDSRLSKLTDAQAFPLDFAYDTTTVPGNFKITTTEAQSGGVTAVKSLTLDQRGNPVRIEDAQGGLALGLYNYDDKGTPGDLTDDKLTVLNSVRVVGLPDVSSSETNDLVTTTHVNERGLPVKEVDVRGNESTTTYNAAGQITSQTDVSGNTTQYFYNDFTGFGTTGFAQGGDLTMVVDPNKRATSFVYDGRGLMKEIRSGAEFNSWTYYDAMTEGGLAALSSPPGSIDPASNPWLAPGISRTMLTYNVYGDTSQVSSNIGRTTTFAHDEIGGQVESSYLEAINGTNYRIVNKTSFDPNARSDGSAQTKVANPGLAGETVATLWSNSTGYDQLNMVTSTTDQFGNITQTLHDNRGQAIQTRRQAFGTDGVEKWLVSWTVYDASGRAEVTTSPVIEGSTETVWGTRSMFDKEGRVVETQQLKNVVVSIVGTGNDIKTVLTSAGIVVSSTTAEYDSLGRNTVSRNRFNAETRTTYNRHGEVSETRTQVKTETGTMVWQVTRTVFDALGRVSVSTDPFLVSADGNETILTAVIMGSQTVYDVQGRTIESRRLRGVSVSLLNGETTLTNRGTVQSSSKSVYNAKGQLEQSVDAAGRIQEFVYDSFGRQSATLDHAVTINGVVQRHRMETVYDSTGRAAQQIANVVQLANGSLDRSQQQTTTPTFDEFGRQVKTTFDDGSFIRSEYDQYGRVVEQFNQLGQQKSSAYDRHGRLTSVELPAVADPQNGGTVTRATYEYRYDARGNMIGLRDPLYGHATADPSSQRQTTFTFDERGNQLTRTLPDGLTESSEYDDFGRMVRQTSFEGVVTEFVYDDTMLGGGRLMQKKFFVSAAAFGAGTVKETQTMTFDAFGREVGVVWQSFGEPQGVSPRWDVWSNEFDEQGRLVKAASPTGTVFAEYDPLGRKTRVMSRTTGFQPVDANDYETDFRYSYDVFGRLSSVSAHERNNVAVDVDAVTAGSQPQTTGYAYSLNGSLKC